VKCATGQLGNASWHFPSCDCLGAPASAIERAGSADNFCWQILSHGLWLGAADTAFGTWWLERWFNVSGSSSNLQPCHGDDADDAVQTVLDSVGSQLT